MGLFCPLPIPPKGDLIHGIEIHTYCDRSMRRRRALNLSEVLSPGLGFPDHEDPPPNIVCSVMGGENPNKMHGISMLGP